MSASLPSFSVRGLAVLMACSHFGPVADIDDCPNLRSSCVSGVARNFVATIDHIIYLDSGR